MGLAFDDWDLEYYTSMFTDMGRDPTNVELFDIAQSNSEHSRHWFFKGDLVIDGQAAPHNLMDIVKAPLDAHPNNRRARVQGVAAPRGGPCEGWGSGRQGGGRGLVWGPVVGSTRALLGGARAPARRRAGMSD